MLVKKINPEWKPSEKPDLAVGDTIEITDPKHLIVSGMAVGVGAKGEELSAYEMYGVLVDTELKEFEEFVKMKKATAIKEQLEEEQKALEAEAAKLKAADEAAKAAEEEDKKSSSKAKAKSTKKSSKK